MSKPQFLPWLLAAPILLIGGGPALAHARLLHADPRVGATVRAAPREVVLSFSERLDLAHSSVAVTGPAGPVATAAPTLEARNPRVLHAPLMGPLPAGAYKVRWHATSEDTHETEGDFSFRVAP